MFVEVLGAFLVGISFGVLFNIKGSRLLLAGIGGGFGWFVYKLCLLFQIGEAFSNFISAICFTIYCEICARKFKTPATTLTVCCLIPLVPGYGVYSTVYEFIVGDYIKATDKGINTLAIAGALALGIIFVSTIFRNININIFIKKIDKTKQ